MRTSAVIDLPRRREPLSKIAVRCEFCGYQALIAVTAGSPLPRLACHECGAPDPLIEYRR